VKYLKDDKIIIGVGSIVQVWGRRVTGARGVRPTHPVLIPNDVGIRVPARAFKGFRSLGRDAREARLHLRKSKPVYGSKVYRKYHPGFLKFLLRKKGGICG
jgi:hypothetical protein